MSDRAAPVTSLQASPATGGRPSLLGRRIATPQSPSTSIQSQLRRSTETTPIAGPSGTMKPFSRSSIPIICDPTSTTDMMDVDQSIPPLILGTICMNALFVNKNRSECCIS
jgi:hypothetical protein